MNKSGHVQTLVAAHPGNRNAVKSGIYSPATLAPHVDELDDAIAERPAQEVEIDILRREVAALVALCEAVDRSLETEGCLGRRGEPRTLISVRLRLNEKLRQTLEQYKKAVGPSPTAGADEHTSSEEATTSDRERPSLAERIATLHDRPSIETVTPAELDPETFLFAVIAAPDQAVKIKDRFRARRMLSKRFARPPTCLCFSTRDASSEFEFRDWIEEMIKDGDKPLEADAIVAARVRRIVGGESEPWAANRRTEEAVNQVVTQATELAQGNGVQDDKRPTGEKDPALRPFWQIALSPDPRVTASERLDALSALDEAGVLPRCTCKPISEHQLWEDRVDARDAAVVRFVAKKHRRAAQFIACFPETYFAVRDAIDARLVSTIRDEDEPPAPAS
jgi:hypothetical protein